MVSKTILLQKKTIKELTKEASRTKAELQSYLTDLKLYSNPDFWEAMLEDETGKTTKYNSIKDFAKKMGCWVTSFSTSFKFDKQFKKLDKRTQKLILKKIKKVIDNPKLGKPMHKPLQNRFSERIEKMRIIYKYLHNHVTFLYFDDRSHVYWFSF